MNIWNKKPEWLKKWFDRETEMGRSDSPKIAWVKFHLRKAGLLPAKHRTAQPVIPTQVAH